MHIHECCDVGMCNIEKADLGFERGGGVLNGCAH